LTSSPGLYHVLLSGRDIDKVNKATAELASLSNLTGTVESLQLDVTDPMSITDAVKSVTSKHGRVDVLVNSAGVIRKAEGLERHNIFREILHTNTVAPLVVTEAFVPLLMVPFPDDNEAPTTKKRVLFVSSSVGSLALAANPAGPYHVATATEYRASKAALNMIMVQFHSRLKGDGILVFGADPGLVATGFSGNAEELRKRGGVAPEVGGERIADIVSGKRDEDVGKVCGPNGVVCPW
jgi:NAD(P)-dependent dehydrogenase (short-subunit alcohol dehydrogenase family)